MKWRNRLIAVRSASSQAEISDAFKARTDKYCQKSIPSPFGGTLFGRKSEYEESEIEETIIRTVRLWQSSEGNTVSKVDAVEIYAAKLAEVKGDPKLAKLFDEICEERKAIMILDGGLSEVDAEAFVSSLEFLMVALMQT